MEKFVLIRTSLLILGLSVCGSFAKASPVAIIFDIQGKIDPRLSLFSELSAETKLALSDETVLTFSHYKTCQKVTVKGGTIKFSHDKFKIYRGELLEKVKEDCVERITLQNKTTQVGSVKLRSIMKKMSPIGTSPIFIAAAENWPKGSEVSLFRTDGVLVTQLNIEGRKASLPDGSPRLKLGSEYILKVNIKNNILTKSKFKCVKNRISITLIDQ